MPVPVGRPVASAAADSPSVCLRLQGEEPSVMGDLSEDAEACGKPYQGEEVHAVCCRAYLKR